MQNSLAYCFALLDFGRTLGNGLMFTSAVIYIRVQVYKSARLGIGTQD
jgi:hypothetical protein